MRLEFSSNDPATLFAEDEFNQTAVSDDGAAETAEMLRSGIKAAQGGNRSEARQMLLRVTEADPKNENAWLWLASISEYPEELLVFLNNVLDINPENERALEWAKATKSLLAKNFVQRGIEADRENRRDFARQCFMQAVVHDRRNEMAWLWLASIADTNEEKAAHLQRVLEINPKNETALTSLKLAKNQTSGSSLLARANAAAIAGDSESARALLEEILKKSPETEAAWILKSHLSTSFGEKAECFEKILEFNPESRTAKVNLDSLRAMMRQDESVEEQDTPIFAARNADETESFNSPKQELFLSPEPEAELEAAFAENQANSEFAEMPDANFSKAEAEAGELSEYQETCETELSDFHFETDANPAEEYLFENSQNSFQENFAETESEEFSSENPFGEELLFEEIGANGTDENSDDCYELDAAEVFAAGEMAENDFSANSAEPEQNFSETEEIYPAEQSAENHTEAAEEHHTETAEEHLENPAFAPADCPFCEQENESRAFICQVCNTMLTLSDLEMLLAHEEANRGIVQAAIEELELEQNKRELECAELINLGIGHINLKNIRTGLTVLQKAARLDPNNVVLNSQVNSLAIRLSEIEEKESTQPFIPRDRTIMVVDDSATVRKLISGKLEKCGHIVITAVDGMDAMEKLGDVTPDLILLDIAMPRMDGYQVCKLIRNNDSTREIPIVMISGKDGFFDKVRGRMAGTTSYITKPFGPETLMKMLETYLV